MNFRALIVEDDRSSQRALRTILETEGFEVEVVDDGDAAIERLDARDYDVILLDLVLPTVSGAEVMEHLRRTKPAQLEKVVVVTGLHIDEIRRSFPHVGNALIKPVLPSRLRAIIRERAAASAESCDRPR